MIYIQEKGGKFVYRDGELIAVIPQNGKLEIFMTSLATYKDVDELFEPAIHVSGPVHVSESINEPGFIRPL